MDERSKQESPPCRDMQHARQGVRDEEDMPRRGRGGAAIRHHCPALHAITSSSTMTSCEVIILLLLPSFLDQEK